MVFRVDGCIFIFIQPLHGMFDDLEWNKKFGKEGSNLHGHLMSSMDVTLSPTLISPTPAYSSFSCIKIHDKIITILI